MVALGPLDVTEGGRSGPRSGHNKCQLFIAA